MMNMESSAGQPVSGGVSGNQPAAPAPPTASRIGLVTVMSNAQIAAAEAAKEVDEAALEAQRRAEALVGNLGSYISRCFQTARDAKQVHQQEMMSALRACNNEYDPDKLAEIKEFGGSDIYMPLISSIARTAYAWLRDVVLPEGGRPFSIEPTPVPDLPPDVTERIVTETLQEAAFAAQMSGVPVPPSMVEARARMRYDDTQKRLKDEAALRASRMETKIDDDFTEGGYYRALDEALPDIISLKLGCVKGPVVNKKKALRWEQVNGAWTPVVDEKAKPVYYRVSPLDLYPGADSQGINDGHLFERIKYRRAGLYAMIGEEGYSEKHLRAALEEYQRGFDLNLPEDQQRNNVEGNQQYQDAIDKTIDGIEFRGNVKGKWLVEWGMAKAQVPDQDREYEVTALQIGRYTVRCVLNEDPLGERPYGVAYYDKATTGGFWGRGIPWLLRDLQAMVNACARSISNNLGMASMPLVEIEIDRFADGQEVKSIFPGMIIQTKSNASGTPGPAVRFTTVPLVVAAMLEVYKYFASLAAQYSGIPSYEQGVNPKSGAAGTASGLSMLMNATTRQFKAVVASTDSITEGAATRTFNYEMQYGTDPNIKGDAQVKALGTSAILVKEQMQMRRAEFLQATNNPIDMSIIGPEGRAEVLRTVADGIDLPDIVPNKEAMLEKVRAAAMQSVGLPPSGGGQVAPGVATDPAGAPTGGRAANLVS